MARRVSAAQAKAGLASLLGEVAYGGQRVVIERHGRPVAALVGIKDLEALERVDNPEGGKEPTGFLALAGAWGDVGDERIDETIEEIYAQREKDQGRRVDLGD